MRRLIASALLFAMAPAAPALAQAAPDFAALASDRVAHRVGDTLTVLVIESSTASRSAGARSSRSISVDAEARRVTAYQAGLEIAGGFAGEGANGRSGALLAQLSVTVDAIEANGDLKVSGQQILNIDGERMRIRLTGRVRPADISTQNAVLSSRMAGVVIDYDGEGVLTRSTRPGLLVRILNFLGLM
jgi:flagellar L-ring protein precursor FlgH